MTKPYIDKLMKAFTKHADEENEVTVDGLANVLDEVGIKNSTKQIEHLFRLIDTDKDVNVSKAEFAKYLETYNEKKSLGANILSINNSRGKKLQIFKEILEVKLTLTDHDYFLKEECDYTTIMNSDYAALTRWEQLLAELKDGERYFDVEFGPKDKDDERGSKMALYSNGEAPPGYIKPEQIEWLTPKEICGHDNYKFTDEEASSNEVIQGALGDCWFIGALSVLASRDELLIGGLDQYRSLKGVDITPSIAKSMTLGVFPPIFQAYAKRGLYVFKFFKNFGWRYVIIDDRLPCYKSNRTPVFGRCKSNDELWVPLIEKAYAKLHCCYESLVSGFIDDALTDLTGFVAEKINLHDKRGVFPNKKLGTKDEFWDYLTSRRKEQSMLGCARKDETVEGEVIIDGERTGILSRHAYGLLDVFEIKGNQSQELFRLLRVRNPWGKTEWVGDWSDTSDEIEKYQEELNQYIGNLEKDEKFGLGDEDGTFLISYDDWSNIYNKLYVTIDFPQDWSGIR